MKVFGLIGKPLTHSFSPAYFREKFSRENLPECDYRLFPLDDISDLPELLRNNPQIKGLNVTIPYKTDVIGLLDTLDETAQQIGAVNTIKITRQNNALFLKGYNTDSFGFLHSCEGLQNNNNALIIGTGGSAKAVQYALQSLGIQYLSVSRNPSGAKEISYHDLTAEVLNRYKLLINTTPLGMFPNTLEAPPLPYAHIGNGHFLFDLIYNPPETLFMAKGKAAGAKIQNGELMLELQAERAWEIWNS
jgi:shikimate dehydrogenase